MTGNGNKPPSDYEVGKGHPPLENQFKKGQSGNPKGRPKAKSRVDIDLDHILNKLVTVAKSGTKTRMSPKEVGLHSLLKKALKGDLKAIKHLMSQFEKYDAIDWPALGASYGVVTMPNTMPFSMAVDIFQVFGKPPWTPRQIALGRANYVKNRTEEERIEDEAIGYSDL